MSGRQIRHQKKSVVIEPEPRGTAGALRFAADHLEERFFLFNGDSFFDTNWLDLMLAVAPMDPVAVMALRRVADTSRYGVATLQGDQVVGFSERGDCTPGLINSGIYLLHRRILSSLPEEGSLEREVLPGGSTPSRWYLTGFLAPFESPNWKCRKDDTDQRFFSIETAP